MTEHRQLPPLAGASGSGGFRHLSPVPDARCPIRFRVVALWSALLGGVAGSAVAHARPHVAPASFELTGVESPQPVSVTVVCGNTRVSSSSGVAQLKVEEVPTRATRHCAAHFTGPIDAWYAPVVGGIDYSCRFVDQVLFCNGWTSAEPTTRPVVAPPPELTVSVKQVEAGAAGTVSVSLDDPKIAQWSLLECPGGARMRADFTAGSTRFEGVPDEDCILYVKGGRPGRYVGVRPGDVLECREAGQATRCSRKHELQLAAATTVRARPGKSYSPVINEVAEAGQLIVRIADPSVSTAIEVNCPSGHRARALFSEGVARLNDVPSEHCVVSFKGGSPARFDGVTSGESLNCTLIGVRADCTR